MTIHFVATDDHELFLMMQLLGLLSQSRRRVGDLLRLLVDLRGPSFQTRLVQVQGLLEIGETSLPLNNLLAESRRRQTMLVAGNVQIQFLLTHALNFGLEIATYNLQIATALADIAVNLGEMFAQLLARLR